MTAGSEHDILIIGGGNAGLAAAGRMLRKGIGDVAVIEPQHVHTYRPLLSYVGGGGARLVEAQRSQRTATPPGTGRIVDTAARIDPAAHEVHCASGAVHRYRDLVLGPGLVPDTGELPDLAAAIDSDAVTSNYLDRAEKTWELVQSMPAGGHAVFTVPREPVSCSGTTVKPLFLAAAHWKATGRLPGVRLTLLVDRPALLGVGDIDDRLDRHFAALGVDVRTDTAVTAIDPGARRLTLRTGDGAVTDLDYDLLHLVPPFRGAPVIAASGLVGDAPYGLADVDPGTLRHRAHPDIWAAGDGATVDTDPSGGALRRQIDVLVDNLLAAREGRSLRRYDGYTVAPIATDAHRLILGEFDREGLASSLPGVLDPLAPRRTAWAFDRYALPRIYWTLLLRGWL